MLSGNFDPAGSYRTGPPTSSRKCLCPRKPLRENLNTGRNASNSRFFSDCYRRRGLANTIAKQSLGAHACCHISHPRNPRAKVPGAAETSCRINGLFPFKANGRPEGRPQGKSFEALGSASVRLTAQKRRNLELI